MYVCLNKHKHKINFKPMNKRKLVIFLNVAVLVFVVGFLFVFTGFGDVLQNNLASVLGKPSVSNLSPSRNSKISVATDTTFKWNWSANGYKLVGHSLCFGKSSSLSASSTGTYCFASTTKNSLKVKASDWLSILKKVYSYKNLPKNPNEAMFWYVKSEYKNSSSGTYTNASYYVYSKSWNFTLIK